MTGWTGSGGLTLLGGSQDMGKVISGAGGLRKGIFQLKERRGH